jgi:hypothetical protein
MVPSIEPETIVTSVPDFEASAIVEIREECWVKEPISSPVLADRALITDLLTRIHRQPVKHKCTHRPVNMQ